LTSLLTGVINTINRCITPFPIKPTLDTVKWVRKATGLEKDSRAAEGIAFGMSGFFCFEDEYAGGHGKYTRNGDERRNTSCIVQAQ
jgi:hypothetical protein